MNKLTPSQHEWLVDRLDQHGRIACPGRNGFVVASWLRVMQNLRRGGLVEPNSHGEYELTIKGQAYREGALAVEIVWLEHLSLHLRLTVDTKILQLVSETIGPNVAHPEETKVGVSDRWAALRGSRAIARCRSLPRHGGGLNG